MENSNNNVTGRLTELGLTSHEAAIYLAVLKHGEVSAGIVLDEVKLHREQVYRALKRLVDEGYLTQFEKRKRAYFSAVDPNILVQQTKAKVAVAEEVLPYLNKIRTQTPQVITITEGEDSLRLQLEDMLATLPYGGEYLVLGGVGSLYYDVVKKFMPLYTKRFAKKNIHGKIIVYKGAEGQYPKDMLLGGRLSIHTLHRPTENPASTVIYGNKVAICLMDPESFAVITITNEKVAKAYRATFDALWK